MDRRNEIIELYLKFYDSHNFPVISGEDLLITIDPSLEFRNCTICHLKEQYILGKNLESYVVAQHCLRTNNFKSIHSNKFSEYEWSANLTMIGGFQKINKETDVHFTFIQNMELQKEFLLSILPQGKYLEIFIIKDLLQLGYIDCEDLRSIENELTKIKIVSDEEYKLTWKYDLGEIKGLGTEWVIRDEYDETFSCIFGDVILLMDNYLPIGIDFGGGLEVLLQGIDSGLHKILYNDYSKGEVEKFLRMSQNHRKLVDSMSVIIDISFYELKSDLTQKTKYILSQYLKAAVVLIEALEISSEKLEQIMVIIYQNKDYLSFNRSLFELIKVKLNRYMGYLKKRQLPSKYATPLENSLSE